jgi:hypothetical protein
MNHKPFIVAIGSIIAVGIILIVASGPDALVSVPPGDTWTLTFSMPASNRPAAFQTPITPGTR